MKKKVSISYLIMIIILFLTLTFAHYHYNHRSIGAYDIKLSTDVPFFETKRASPSVLSFSLKVVNKKTGTIEHELGSHCFIYAHRAYATYIALPRHSFPFSINDSVRRFEMKISDSVGNVINPNIYKVKYSTNYDALMFEVQKLDLPALSNSGVISDGKIVGDSAIILSPFNSRNIPRKIGFFQNDNSVRMKSVFSETGDSGSLVVGRYGVVGVMVSLSSSGRVGNFVPISVFESLYVGLTTR